MVRVGVIGSIFFLLFFLESIICGLLSEPDRIEYFRRHHSWPPTWHHENPEYKLLMEQRESEILDIPAMDERWENWMQVSFDFLTFL